MVYSPALMGHAFTMGSQEDRATTLVRNRLQLSIDRYGGQNEIFRQLHRYYLSLTPRIRPRDNDRSVTETSRYPNVFVPRSFTAVEASVPSWVFSVVGGNPPVRVYARTEEKEDNARAVQKMIGYDWRRSDVLFRSIDVAKQIFKYGTGIAKIGYKHDEYVVKRKYQMDTARGRNLAGKLLLHTVRLTEEEPVTRFDGPWLDPINVYNFHPDPYYHRIGDMRYACYRRWSDRATLKLESEQHEQLTGKPLYRHLDKIPRIPRGYIEQNYGVDTSDDLQEAMGWSGGLSYVTDRYTGVPGFHGADPEEDLVEVIEYWDRDDRVIYLANGQTPILDTENWFDDKELPFVASKCYHLDNQFWGYGLLHVGAPTQEEINEHRNIMIRQAQLNTENVWAYDEDMGLPSGLDQIEPGRMYPVHWSTDGKPRITPLLQGRPMPPDAYQMEDRMDADLQTALAMPQYRSGQSSRSETATAAQIAAANVEARNRLMALSGELSYATEIARFFHSRRQQYLKDGDEFRIEGKDGIHYEKMDREDIAGEFDFLVAGTNLYASREVLRQQFQQALTIVGANPAYMERTDVDEVLEHMWRMFDIPNAEKFMRPVPLRTWNPQRENTVLAYGEPIEVEANDNHEEHIQVHMQGMAEAPDREAMERFQEHIEEHQRYVSFQASQRPPQEMPGIRGHGGNVPNLENAVESPAGIQSRIRGAGQRT